MFRYTEFSLSGANCLGNSPLAELPIRYYTIYTIKYMVDVIVSVV